MVEAVREGVRLDPGVEESSGVLSPSSVSGSACKPTGLSPYYQGILDAAEVGRAERIRLGDIATSQRPPLPVATDGA